MSGLLQAVDERLFGLINRSLANPLGDAILPRLNHAAPFIPIAILGLIGLAYCNSRRLWLLAGCLVLGVALGDALIFNPLKHQIARPRPAAVLTDVRTLASGAAGGKSFPSSHTANAFLVAAVLAGMFPGRRTAFLAVAAVIGFSRIYVGVHYPSDVVGSGLLGWFLGKGWLQGCRWLRHRIAWQPGSASDTLPSERETGRSCIATVCRSGWLPWLLLAAIQGVRLGWTATTQLDVPPMAAWLWCRSSIPGFDPVSPNPLAAGIAGIAIGLAKLWFGLFGSAPLALWAIPWALQSAWLVLLAALSLRRHGSSGVWGVFAVSLLIPFVSQLSFLGSPAEALQSSEGSGVEPTWAFLWLGLLGLPLWIAALWHFRAHPVAAGCSISGWILGAGFPSIPWGVTLLLTSGTILALAGRLAEWKRTALSADGGGVRAAFTAALAYGLIAGVAVYQPSFLRKLNISFLPRNHPHYVQTGWREWVARIRPQLAASTCREIWAESPTSRDQIQYLLGGQFRVVAVAPLPTVPAIPSGGVFYNREVEFARIHPRLIFLGRNPWFRYVIQPRAREMDSTEIFRHGDPIRQFQLYFVPSA